MYLNKNKTTEIHWCTKRICDCILLWHKSKQIKSTPHAKVYANIKYYPFKITKRIETLISVMHSLKPYIDKKHKQNLILRNSKPQVRLQCQIYSPYIILPIRSRTSFGVQPGQCIKVSPTVQHIRFCKIKYKCLHRIHFFEGFPRAKAHIY